MWGVEHTLMASAFGCLALWVAWKRNWVWLGAAAMSQVPFWAGLAAYMAIGDKDPVGINMALNLFVAGAFIEWSHKLQLAGRGGIVHVWLCAIFLFGCTIDILQVVFPTHIYVLLQEVIHYLALITIGGRAYVRGFDGNRRHSRDTLGTKADGGLV